MKLLPGLSCPLVVLSEAAGPGPGDTDLPWSRDEDMSQLMMMTMKTCPGCFNLDYNKVYVSKNCLVDAIWYRIMGIEFHILFTLRHKQCIVIQGWGSWICWQSSILRDTSCHWHISCKSHNQCVTMLSCWQVANSGEESLPQSQWGTIFTPN